jgi:hypothetical protein
VSFENTLAVVLGVGVLGVVILAILWPTRRAAARLLHRWGVPDSTLAERTEALHYLRRRRFWYPWLFFGLPAAANATGLAPAGSNALWSIPAVILFGALLAELLAQRRSRAAPATRPRIAEIVPAWVLTVHFAAALGAVVLLGSALGGQAWARAWYPDWSPHNLTIALGAAVLTTLVSWVVIGLAIRRPPTAQPRIDPLLRARSARVPAGLSIAVLCALAGGTHGSLRSAIFLGTGLVLWTATASPPARRPIAA